MTPVLQEDEDDVAAGVQYIEDDSDSGGSLYTGSGEGGAQPTRASARQSQRQLRSRVRSAGFLGLLVLPVLPVLLPSPWCADTLTGVHVSPCTCSLWLPLAPTFRARPDL
jgi:hypothetical protein